MALGQNSALRLDDVSRDYQSATTHHQAGRYDRAEALYRRVLRRAPDHVEALHLLGVIAHERERHEDAVELISRALAGSPAFADAHQNLGCALRALGRFDEAVASYRRAIDLAPDHGLAHCNLSTTLNSRGAFEAALESAARAVELMPEFLEAHVNCGAALTGQGRFAEAEAAYRKALALQPDRAETLSDLGHILTELKRLDEAIACHQQAVTRQPNSAIMQLRLAATLFKAGDPYGSEAICRRGISLDPNSAEAWSALGQMLRSVGEFDEARSCFLRARALDPELPHAYAGLAIIGERADNEAELQHLRAVLARPDSPAATRSDAGFALGMLLDNAGRYDEAFPCFAEANALGRQQLAARGQLFDRTLQRQHVDSLIASCTPEFFAQVEGEGNPSEVPVFIVGMPRSGTSLVEQIAATHSRVTGVGELMDISRISDQVQAHGRDRSPEELDSDLAPRLADDYVVHLKRFGMGAARVVDKMPDNILHLGLIAVLFPAARVIFCRRDLRDTCLSCYFCRFDETIPYAFDLGDCGVRALEIERLADHWRRVLPLRMLTIDHEVLVTDLEGESRRLIEFLGLDWEPGCLEFHKTGRPILSASGWQVRQPLFTRSMGRWRKYERHLQPLFEVLAERRPTG